MFTLAISFLQCIECVSVHRSLPISVLNLGLCQTEDLSTVRYDGWFKYSIFNVSSFNVFYLVLNPFFFL